MHAYFMDEIKEMCRLANLKTHHVYECVSCGNHVCRECAERNSLLCPFCFGRLSLPN